MLLPVVFLCNALLLLTVLNSRFRLLAEAIVSGGVFVLSILLNLLLSLPLTTRRGNSATA